jgi:hypothetical protein
MQGLAIAQAEQQLGLIRSGSLNQFPQSAIAYGGRFAIARYPTAHIF